MNEKWSVLDVREHRSELFNKERPMQLAQNGFTLVELITVIILLGILSAIALPRFFDNQTFTDSFERSDFKSALTWVRNRSVTSQCTHELRITTAGWQVLRDVDCSSVNIEAACTTETLDFSTSVNDGLGSALTGDGPVISTGVQRLIFSSTGQLYTLSVAPITANCTVLPASPIASGSTIALSNSLLTMDGGTAYVDIQ